MNKTSIVAIISLFVFILFGVADAQEAIWPLKIRPDLSSGFGEFRQNRYHAGIDLRTGGRIGQRVYSPVDGFVWRVKMSYRGYGKGLYVKGDDGYVYVFAHLSQFVPKIDEAVKKAQREIKRYYLDKYFQKDSIRVSKGEVIAFSGQTGVGAPHLHFERRSPDNVPLNPLSHGLHLADKTRPVFTRLGIELTGESSLLPDKRRRVSLTIADSLQKDDGTIELPSTFYLDRNFGVVAGCFDRIRPKGMKQTIYKLTLSIDGQQRYTSVFDTLPFARGEFVNLDYDQLAADSGDTRVRRLYRQKNGASTGGISSSSSSSSTQSGILGPNLSFGLHHCVITAEDNTGNISRLKFNFLWGGNRGLYTKDSVVQVNDSLVRYYFTANGDMAKLGIDSSVVELIQKDNAYQSPISSVIHNAGGHIVTEVRGLHVRTRVFRLRHYSSYGPEIVDNPFHGMFIKGQKALIVTHQVLDDGLLVTAQSNSLRALEGRVMLYHGDTLLGIEKPDRFYSIAYYHFFIPPREKYRRVDRIAVALSPDSVKGHPAFEKDLTLGVVGYAERETLAIDTLMSVEFTRENLFKPKWIEIKRNPIDRGYKLGLNSDVYDIFPNVFAVRGRYRIVFGLPPVKKFSKNDRSGICWLDIKEDHWVWLDDNQLVDNKLFAGSIGGGTFAVVFDDNVPFIKGKNIVDERTYNTLLPTFEFKLGDSLSGIENDLNIVITIDDKWQLPEYDPEREICVTRPPSLLSEGRHKLKVTVTDRAGNVFDEGWYFRTRASHKPKKRSR